MNFVEYKVGKCYESFQTMNASPVISFKDGSITLLLPTDNLSAEDFRRLKEDSFTLTFKTIHALNVFNLTFGDLAFEIPYNPALESPGFMPDEGYDDNEGIPLFMYAVNTMTGKLDNVRMCGLGHYFTLSLKRIVYKQLEDWMHVYKTDEFDKLLNAYFSVPLEITSQMKGEHDISYTLPIENR